MSPQAEESEKTLVEIVGKQFSASVRQRGEEYFAAGTVAILGGSASDLTAEVRGSGVYHAEIRYTADRLKMVCTCPFFSDYGQKCKHLWALVLAADEGGYLSRARTYTPPKPVPVGTLAPTPAWKQQLNRIANTGAPRQPASRPWPELQEVVYLLDVVKSQTSGKMVVTVATRGRSKEDGRTSAPKPFAIDLDFVDALPLQEDREIIGMLLGGVRYNTFGYYEPRDQGHHTFSVPQTIAHTLVPRIVRSGRCLAVAEKAEGARALTWDDGEPWRFLVEVRGNQAEGWRLEGCFRRGEQRMGVNEPLMETADGFLVTRSWVARLERDRGFAWIQDFRSQGFIAVPEQERAEFLTALLNSPALPALDLPDSWQFDEVMGTPRKCLRIYESRFRFKGEPRLAELSFDYEGRLVAEQEKISGVYHAAGRRFVRRDRDAEKSAAAELLEHGLKPANNYTAEPAWTVPVNRMPGIVRNLVEADWQVSWEGKAIRQPGQFQISVASGVDWFELQGGASFGEIAAPLPKLLAALKRGDTMMTLADGSYGLLPEEFLRRFSAIAAMGDTQEDHIRFAPSQAGLLDALLATQPAVDCDAAFRRVREELERFQAIGPAEQPAGFHGSLREYQREGLAWMHFLRQFSFGGCLADDMGVGKTAQVLALLETRRELRARGELDAPSLVVVPKSLIFNWKQEAARFTPQIRVLDYTGIGRNKHELAGWDVVLTTYGTLRKDVVHFRDQVFDYVILDEAQAVKNAKTASAKAVRLLRGNHRLALSGTPVENHLGELWSLLEFLNPGMLGSFGAFQVVGGSLRNSGDDTRALLGHALRPFLLRRTKEQVAPELPPKVEQTIYCEMEPQQKLMYDELRDHYRASLLGRIEREGVGKSQIQVLEALLRLRQAACHPGLIDGRRTADPSAKLDVLLQQLRVVLDEGHKALVFSQFTSLLRIVRDRLDADGVPYEYLDGKTQQREACVERFQNDPACRLFLISLKAGGVGLNLTAADYVFILDPWWNPAVEAQAVDRTHRIGQVRQVFAYRLITRGTVEEKVLELQETKRLLADAILGEQNSLIRDLKAEDIALLLS